MRKKSIFSPGLAPGGHSKHYLLAKHTSRWPSGRDTGTGGNTESLPVNTNFFNYYNPLHPGKEEWPMVDTNGAVMAASVSTAIYTHSYFQWNESMKPVTIASFSPVTSSHRVQPGARDVGRPGQAREFTKFLSACKGDTSAVFSISAAAVPVTSVTSSRSLFGVAGTFFSKTAELFQPGAQHITRPFSSLEGGCRDRNVLLTANGVSQCQRDRQVSFVINPRPEGTKNKNEGMSSNSSMPPFPSHSTAKEPITH